ncbi:MAG: methyltransferase domain-containing protein [Terriglobia bacterium]
MAMASSYDAPFDAIAATYDESFTHSLTGEAQRRSTWREFGHAFHPGQRILELNCGTGVDAVHLADRGVEVVACDVAPQMIQVARARLTRVGSRAAIDFRVLATEDIAELQREGPFDGVFSNFAGLNCVENLRRVASDLAGLLKPGAPAVLCFAGRYVAWEMLWYLAQRDTRKAFRRLQPGPVTGHIAARVSVQVHYRSVRQLSRTFAPEFRLRRWKGVGVVVPPSYLERHARQYPNVMTLLESVDRLAGRCPLVRGLADHVLLTFERR